MAPQPKKRMAKARTRTRKSTKKISLPHLVECPKCKAIRLPHRACPSCGYYREFEQKTSIEGSKK